MLIELKEMRNEKKKGRYQNERTTKADIQKYVKNRKKKKRIY